MRIIKRLTIVMLGLTLVMSMLSACGGGSDSASDETANTAEETQAVEETTDETATTEAPEAPEAGEVNGLFFEGGASDYDVEKGFEKKTSDDGSVEYLYFNDFMMTMPANEKWGFEMNGNEVTFFLFAAQQEGFGGRLVTIKAYDMDDNSYEEMPIPYQVAGVAQNVNKRFLAIYPSDVQYNFDDEKQQADYLELFEYVKKIGEGAVDSPLQTSDSNPE